MKLSLGNIKNIPLAQAWIGLLLFVVFFQDLFNAGTRSSLFDFTDELFYVFAVTYVLLKTVQNMRIHQFVLALLIVLGYMLLISFVFGNQPNGIKVLIQSLMHLKFFVFIAFFYYLIDANPKFKMLSILRFFVIFCIIGLGLELLLKGTFYNLMQVEEHLLPSSRKDKVVYGGFIKANVLSLLILVYFIVVSQLKQYKPAKFLFWAALIFLFFIAVRSRTPIMLLLIFVLVHYRKKLLKPAYIVSTITAMVVSGIVLATQTNFVEKTIENVSLFFTKDSHYIRGIMYYLSGEVSTDYFPIGSGAATFGTVLSEDSIVYQDYGVSGRSFFIKMDGIYDSNFASILGEFGFIGIFLFLFLFYLVRTLFREKNYKTEIYTTLALATIFYLFISPLWMNSFLSLALAMGFAVMLNPKKRHA